MVMMMTFLVLSREGGRRWRSSCMLLRLLQQLLLLWCSCSCCSGRSSSVDGKMGGADVVRGTVAAAVDGSAACLLRRGDGDLPRSIIRVTFWTSASGGSRAPVTPPQW